VPKGPPPAWSRRDCRFDHLVTAALDKGFGVVLVYSGIETEERAHDVRRGIYRCAKHRGVSADAGRRIMAAGSDPTGVSRAADGTFTLRFRIWDKRAARASHIKRNGTDRGQWAYNPRGKATAEERESWANRDEHGRIVQ
jgi:hypothetical protein